MVLVFVHVPLRVLQPTGFITIYSLRISDYLSSTEDS
jgi:hypothetical protein